MLRALFGGGFALILILVWIQFNLSEGFARGANNPPFAMRLQRMGHPFLDVELPNWRLLSFQFKGSLIVLRSWRCVRRGF